MYLLDGLKINISLPHIGPDGTKYPNLLVPAWRETLGVVEVPDPARKDDRFYYITEEPDGSLIQDPREVGYCKAMLLRDVKRTAGVLLASTDWYITREAENVGKPASAAVKQARKAIRDASDANEALINACSTVDELAALQMAWPEQR